MIFIVDAWEEKTSQQTPRKNMLLHIKASSSFHRGDLMLAQTSRINSGYASELH